MPNPLSGLSVLRWRRRGDSGARLMVAVSLALGLSTATMLFGITDVVFFRPPGAVRAPQQLRRVWVSSRDSAGTFIRSAPVVSSRDYEWLRSAMAPKASLAAYSTSTVQADVGGRVTELRGAVVSDNYFAVLGTEAARGRTIAPDTDPAARGGVVISHQLWTTRFNRSSGVLDSAITVNGQRLSIIGVARDGFVGIDPLGVDLWMDFETAPSVGILSRQESRTTEFLSLVLRPADGVPSTSLGSRLSAALQNLRIEYPDFGLRTGRLGPLGRGRFASDPDRASIMPAALIGMVGLLLAIGCGNAVVLLLVIGLKRESEFATKIALGAGWRALAAEAARESLILVLAGLLLGGGLVALLGYCLPGTVASPGAAVLNARVYLFGVPAALLAGAACFIPPLFVSTRVDVGSALRVGGGGASIGPSVRRVCNGLLLLQTSVAVAILIAAEMLVGNVWRVTHLEMGFDAAGVYTLSPVLDVAAAASATGMTATGAVGAMRSRVEEAVLQLPEVESAGWAESIPMKSAEQVTLSADIGGEGVPLTVLLNAVDSRFFRTLGVPLLAGRVFTDGERSAGRSVVVINAALARSMGNPHAVLGRCLTKSFGSRPCPTIIGIVGDVRYLGMWDSAAPTVYQPLNGESTSGGQFLRPRTLLVRTRPGARDVPVRLRSALAARGVPPSGVEVLTMSDIVRNQSARWQLGAMAFVAAGAIALVLALLGVFSVVSVEVMRRRREIAIRMALGSPSRSTVWAVARTPLWFSLSGLILGSLSGFAVAALLRHLLVGLVASSVLSFASLVLVLGATCLAAALLPARIALRTQPDSVLRGA